MDLIAERGIAAHYSGRVVPGLVGKEIPGGRNSKGKTTCLNNTDFALRVCKLFLLVVYEGIQVVTLWYYFGTL